LSLHLLRKFLRPPRVRPRQLVKLLLPNL